MDDDDYWNTSETKAKAFSFDDDVVTKYFTIEKFSNTTCLRVLYF